MQKERAKARAEAGKQRELLRKKKLKVQGSPSSHCLHQG